MVFINFLLRSETDIAEWHPLSCCHIWQFLLKNKKYLKTWVTNLPFQKEIVEMNKQQHKPTAFFSRGMLSEESSLSSSGSISVFNTFLSTLLEETGMEQQAGGFLGLLFKQGCRSLPAVTQQVGGAQSCPILYFSFPC